jgi:hypothetical protein
MLTGRRVYRIPVSYSPGYDDYEELEGITLWDLDEVTAPCRESGDACVNGRLRGQLHLLMLGNSPNPNDLYLKHFRVTRDRDRI